MTQNHQGAIKFIKTILLITISIDKIDLQYPHIRALNDAVVREIVKNREISTIKINENPNYFLIPEIYTKNSPDNAIILEWWEDQQIEYRFSFYRGSDGLSLVIDRGSLPSGDTSLNLNERNRIIEAISKIGDF